MWPMWTKQFIGLDISTAIIKAVRIERNKRVWRLLENHLLPLPEGVIKPSFKNDNILDVGRFAETVQLLVRNLEVKTATVGLSLPSEIVKTLIQGYEKLPDSRAEVEKFIGWSMERSFHFPVQSAKIGYQSIGQDPAGLNQLLVTVAMRSVVAQYETLLQRLGLDTRVVRPAGINLFNFFCPRLPRSGTHAFLGLFENYFNFLVFQDTQLTFFHGVKRGFADLQFFQDVDMTLQHYVETNPGKKIRRLSVGSQVGYHKELREVLGNLIDVQVDILQEAQLIASDFRVDEPLEQLKLSALASAIGAAQSMAH
jgi:Tfp pilus assembly PilM family ATPase